MKLDITNKFREEDREKLTPQGIKDELVDFVYDNGELPESMVLSKEQYRQLCYISTNAETLPMSFMGIQLDFVKNKETQETVNIDNLYKEKEAKDKGPDILFSAENSSQGVVEPPIFTEPIL